MDIHLNEMAGDILVFLTGEHSESGLREGTWHHDKVLSLLGNLGGTHVAAAFYDNLNSYRLFILPKIILYCH